MRDCRAPRPIRWYAAITLCVVAPGCGGGDANVTQDAGSVRDVGDGRSDLGARPDLGQVLDLGQVQDLGDGVDASGSADAGPIDGGFPTVIACPGWLGLPSGGVTLASTSPEGVRVGPDCALYVSLNATVYRIEQGTGVVTEFATGTTVTGYQGLDFGPDGHLYVAARSNGNAILRFNGTTGAFIDVFADTGIDGPNTPRFGPDGRLYVSCRNTANVVRFEADGTLLGEFASDALLGSPEGMSFGPDGNLYVAARSNSVLMRFNGVTGALMNQITATPTFMAPEGIGFAPDGSLWVASRDTAEVIHFNGLTFAEIERSSLPGGQPIGLEVVDGQVVVGLRGPGLVTIVP
jgi:streptogramin lyase